MSGLALQQTIQQFEAAYSLSDQNIQHLQSCLEVFKKLSEAEKNAPKAETHRSEYASEDGSGYTDDRGNTSGQPEQKKIRRGVSLHRPRFRNIVLTCFSVLLPQDGVIAAIERRRQNGDVDQMAQERFATPADCVCFLKLCLL